MLDSLYIKNFRVFKQLEIEKLGQVNLIVGKNNSGKSCLLEALYIYAKNASPRILNEKLVRSRMRRVTISIVPDYDKLLDELSMEHGK